MFDLQDIDRTFQDTKKNSRTFQDAVVTMLFLWVGNNSTRRIILDSKSISKMVTDTFSYNMELKNTQIKNTTCSFLLSQKKFKKQLKYLYSDNAAKIMAQNK